MLWIQGERFMVSVKWAIAETLPVIQSRTKRAIICVWSFLYIFFSPQSCLLWSDAVAFPKWECSCLRMSGRKISITRNVSQTINNVSLQINLVSVNTLFPSTDKRSSRQMLEFIIPHFPFLWEQGPVSELPCEFCRRSYWVASVCQMLLRNYTNSPEKSVLSLLYQIRKLRLRERKWLA